LAIIFNPWKRQTMGRFAIIGRSGSRLSTSSGTGDNLVHEICERSVTEIVARLTEDLAPMAAAELRGYVRSRSHETIRTRAVELAATHRLSAEKTEELFQRALERTVQLIARDQKTRRPASEGQVPLRLAG
jgi:hypothetical protein